jgi:hypothetical protein
MGFGRTNEPGILRPMFGRLGRVEKRIGALNIADRPDDDGAFRRRLSGYYRSRRSVQTERLVSRPLMSTVALYAVRGRQDVPYP